MKALGITQAEKHVNIYRHSPVARKKTKTVGSTNLDILEKLLRVSALEYICPGVLYLRELWHHSRAQNTSWSSSLVAFLAMHGALGLIMRWQNVVCADTPRHLHPTKTLASHITTLMLVFPLHLKLSVLSKVQALLAAG